MITIKKCVSETTGRAYTEISGDGCCVAHNYFTVSSFTSDGQHAVLAAFTDDGTTKPLCRYFVIDLKSGEYEFITDEVRWETASVCADDKLYYTNGNILYCTDIFKKQTKILWRAPQGYGFHGPVSVTNDCRYLGVYWSENEKNSTFGVFDTVRGEMDIAGTVTFMPPFEFADHGMICPADPGLMFFAHEGSCFYITDRLWLMNTKTGQTRNLFRQRLTESGANADCVGHEFWKKDGSGLFFCKYAVSPTEPRGIYFCDLEGRARCINSESDHWHAAADKDGLFVVSDTGSAGVESDIMLTETATGKSVKLEHIPRWPNHPGHPHPCFAPEGKRVIYTFKKQDNDLAVAIMDIEDIR